jgi:Flp pilus assembly protein TadB
MTKEKKRNKTFRQQIKIYTDLVNKAGLEIEFETASKNIFKAALIIILAATISFFIYFKVINTHPTDAFAFLVSLWIFGYALVVLLIWFAFLAYIDIMIFERRKEVEQYFPDFLQLTSANINAGMPVDQALWYAIRPRFGFLARDMESVAKSTMVGEKLDKALIEFSEKYDSMTIKRAIALLNEGLESGSEIGDLLSRIANNMRDTEMIKKEMASNVTTYVIFILFATLGAAPFLFGLTTQLVIIMKSIFSQINIGNNAAGGIGAMLSSSNDTIAIADYRIFAMVSITVSSIFAAIIISTIQKGNAKEAWKQIPIYIAIGLGNYLFSTWVMGLLLGGMFN